MGLILDSSVLIAGERRRESVRDILRRALTSIAPPGQRFPACLMFDKVVSVNYGY